MSGLGNSIHPLIPLFLFLVFLFHLNVSAYFCKKELTNAPKNRASPFVKRFFSEMAPMPKHWDTHDEYQHFLSESVTLLNPSQLKRLCPILGLNLLP